jgi:hypothetical protein
MMNGLSAAANGLTAATSDGQAAEFRDRSGTFTRNKPAAQPVA